MPWDVTPKPITRIDQLKKMATEFIEAVTYYSGNMHEIGDNEWGFLAFGFSAGAIMSIITYFVVGSLLASPTPTAPVVDEKKKTK
jgi:hypothetical protein